MKTHLKDSAFALFIKGQSIRSIAKQLNLSKSTVERWSRRELWVDARDRIHHQLVEDSVSKTINSGSDKLSTAINTLYDEILSDVSMLKIAREQGYASKIRKRIVNSLLSTSLAVSRMELCHLDYLKAQQRFVEVEIARLELESTVIKMKNIC